MFIVDSLCVLFLFGAISRCLGPARACRDGSAARLPRLASLRLLLFVCSFACSFYYYAIFIFIVLLIICSTTTGVSRTTTIGSLRELMDSWAPSGRCPKRRRPLGKAISMIAVLVLLILLVIVSLSSVSVSVSSLSSIFRSWHSKRHLSRRALNRTRHSAATNSQLRKPRPRFRHFRRHTPVLKRYGWLRRPRAQLCYHACLSRTRFSFGLPYIMLYCTVPLCNTTSYMI